MHRCLPLWLLLVALLPALAQAADRATREAKRHFQRAEKLYRVGKFEAALEAYSEAYQSKALPAFLFNIGQCQRQLKRFEEAVFSFRSYLREKPEAANRAKVEELIERCEAAMADQQKKTEEQARLAAEQARAAAEAERARAEAERARTEAEAEVERARLEAETEKARLAAEQARAEEEQARLLTQAPPPGQSPAEEPGVHQTWWFWTVIGTVAAAAIAGGVTAAVLSQEDETRTVLPAGSLGAVDLRGE